MSSKKLEIISLKRRLATQQKKFLKHNITDKETEAVNAVCADLRKRIRNLQKRV